MIRNEEELKNPLRPEWAGTKLMKDGKEIGWNPEDGAIRIVMTGTASDKAALQDHVFSKGQKKRLERRFKDPKDPDGTIAIKRIDSDYFEEG